MLDVAPMTRLRPDAHLRPKTDCLHFALPGVPDWWNHLLATVLQEAAERGQRERHGA